ncbi:alpha/beta hydrolase [Novosphingobium kaempferiae]|uniref:alpha/beta hydrolase n=1 Tax=Novosphingobium kaempferiae TaxID=2896849 RepID=UPI001E56E523|nr:alpha/beta fold hydrolase [Novosphingobium kaempferiae]
MRRAYIDSRHGQIHLRECGEGPAVLLAHANPWTSLFWEPVMPLLAAQGFRVIAYDGLGYGNSDSASACLTIEGQAEVMADVGQEMGGVFAVIGWHQGGITGLEFALRDPAACPVLVMDGATTVTDEQAMALATQVIANNPQYPFAGNEAHWWVDMLLGKLRLFNPHFVLDADTWPLFRRLTIGSLQNDPTIATSPSPMVPEAVRAALTPHKRSDVSVSHYDWIARLPALESRLLLLTAEDEPLRPAHDDALAAAPAGHAQFSYPGGHPLIGVGREAEYIEPIAAFLRAHLPAC